MNGAMRLCAVAVSCLVITSCSTLGIPGVQAPRFDRTDRESQLTLLPPSTAQPLGGAGVRIWTRVTNPNGFGLTLARLAGNLLLEGQNAGTIDLPLGLPLVAQGDTIIPIDISLSFADLPGLTNVLRSAVTGNAVNYAIDGTVAIDAGPFGQPSFGPSTLLRGDLRVVR